MFSGHIWSYEHIAKTIKLFRGWEVTDLAPFNIDIDSPLYNSKKNCPWTFSGHIWSYEHIAKRIKLFRGWEVTGLAPFNIDIPLYN